MAPRRPAVSVVLWPSGDEDLLRAALEGLCAQAQLSGDLEVVLVHDGGTAARDTACAFESRLPLTTAVAPAPDLGALWAHGVSLATGDIVVLADGESVAGPGVLEAHRAAHRRHPEPRACVLGATELDPAIAEDPLAQVLLEAHHPRPPVESGTVVPLGFFDPGRFSAKREALVQASLWEGGLPRGCEGLELARRLEVGGFQLRFEGAAASRISRSPDFEGFLRAVERRARADARFVRLNAHDGSARLAHVTGASALWGRVAPVHEALLRSARELDRIARMRTGAGLPVRDADATLVRRGYWTALQICRARSNRLRGTRRRGRSAGGRVIGAKPRRGRRYGCAPFRGAGTYVGRGHNGCARRSHRCPPERPKSDSHGRFLW